MTDRQTDRQTGRQIDRQGYIDVCKAIGIILVVLGHTYAIPVALYNVIYSFHMPLFFILAGMVYNKEKNNKLGFLKYTVKKAKQYLIPYFAFSFVNLLIQIAWRLLISKEGVSVDYLLLKLRGIILCYADMKNMPNCSPIWFLMCLFFSSLLFWWILKICIKWQWVPIVLLVIVYYLLLPYCVDLTSFPFKFPTFLIAVVFHYIGFYLRLFLEKEFKKKYSFVLCLSSVIAVTICFICVAILGIETRTANNYYSSYLLFLGTSMISSIGLIIVIHKASFLCNSFLLWLGKNTIYIIGFNYVCRDLATELYYFIPFVKNVQMHWISSFILTFGLCLLCIIICTKIRLLFVALIRRVRPV